ncbi:MAG: hypothetical protein IKP20_03810 [Candidatus Methanomethylophilaceae archaeon]|nr:hypothetical protein [Candidatus Methanomethylophilaceae archaeon]
MPCRPFPSPPNLPNLPSLIRLIGGRWRPSFVADLSGGERPWVAGCAAILSVPGLC